MENKDEFPDREFTGRQVSLTAKDVETLYWLVEESSIGEQEKERLTNKIRGYFVSPQTEAKSKRLLDKRAAEIRNVTKPLTEIEFKRCLKRELASYGPNCCYWIGNL